MRAELERDFPGAEIEDCEVICDACHVEFVRWRSQLPADEEARLAALLRPDASNTI